MTVEDHIQRTCGGDAAVRVYAADDVVTVPLDVTLAAVAKELCDDEIGIVVIGTPDKPLGVLSERDVVRAVAESRDPSTTRAVDVANTRIVWCDRSATVREAAELMMVHYVRHIFLEDDGRLTGIVSARDLLGAYAISSD